MKSHPGLSSLLVCILCLVSCATPPDRSPTVPVAPAPVPVQDAAELRVPPSPSPPAAESPSPSLVLPTLPQTQPGEADRARLAAFLDGHSFLVYGRPASGTDVPVLRAGLVQANRWLVDRAKRRVVSWEELSPLLTGEASSGDGEAFALSLARTFDPGILVELQYSLSRDAKQGANSAKAQGELLLRSPFSGSVLARLPFSGQPILSPTSLAAAESGALASAIWQILPLLPAAARTALEGELSSGFSHELSLRGFTDQGAMIRLLEAVAPELRSLRLLHAEPGRLDLGLGSFLTREELLKALLAAAKDLGLAPPTASSGPGRLLILSLGS